MSSEQPSLVRQAWLDPLVSLADDRFRIPGTRVRYGLDAIIGALFPAVGDSISTALGAVLVLIAWREGAPPRILARMAANLAVDGAVGAIPLVGDLFDVGYRANRKNHTLLRTFQHQKFGTPLAAAVDSGSPDTDIEMSHQESVNKRSWILGGVLVLLVLVLIALPIALLILAGNWLLAGDG